MGEDPVDIALGSTPIADEQDVLQVVPFFSEFAENCRNQHSERQFQKEIDRHKNSDKKAGIVCAAPYKIKAGGTIQDSDDICFKYVVHL